MIFLGVWACQWRELKPISFGGGGSSNNNQVGSSDQALNGGGDNEENNGDDLAGFSRGRGRGRNRDGGEYEMVGMKEVAEESV
jgi:hypothetical protein